MRERATPYHANASLRNAVSLALSQQHPKLLVTAVLASTSSAAFAQAPTDGSDAGRFEEIIVTASRREQTLQDVPYNISAIGGDALQRANVTDFSRLTSMVPGIAYTDQGDRGAAMTNNIIVRGLETGGAGDLGIGSSNADTVATYINETPLYTNITIKDVQRVEFLRGPQGTLYGSGALGGALRFIYNKPDPSDFSGSVSATPTYTKHGDVGSSVDVVLNAPAAERSAFRLAAGYEDRGGYVDQPLLFARESTRGRPRLADPSDILGSAPIIEVEEDADDAQSKYARASFLADVSDSVTIEVGYHYQDNESGAAPNVNPGFMGNDRYSGSQFLLEELESETSVATFDATVDFGFATLTSNTSRYDTENFAVRDNTNAFYTAGFGVLYIGSPRFIAEALDLRNEDSLVQEFRLTSNGDTKFQYVVGVFYQDQDKELELKEALPGYAEWRIATGIDPFSGGPLPPGFSMPGDIDFLTNEKQSYEETALFGELTYNITDAWQITGGFRAFQTDFATTALFDLPQTEEIFGPGSGSAIGAGVADISDQIYKLNTSYDFTDDLTLYFTFSQGYRRGGSNGLPIVGFFRERPELNLYQPDTVDNLELGVKGRLGNTQFTAAIYEIDWKDLQLTVANIGAGQPFVANGGDARSRGVEFEAFGSIGNSFEYAVGYSYTDAELTSAFDIRVADPFGSGDLMGASAGSGAVGARTPGSPENTFTLSGSYYWTLNDNRQLVFHANGSYRSDVVRNLASDLSDVYIIDAFAVVDTSLALETDRWSAQLFVNNIFNEEGITAVAGNTPDIVDRNRAFFLGRPRTVGLRMTYNWGR
jgi:outer membrane receptor protein involved in Fe transport